MFVRSLTSTVVSRWSLTLWSAGFITVLTAAAPLDDTAPSAVRSDIAAESTSGTQAGKEAGISRQNADPALRDILEIRRAHGGLLDGTLLSQFAAPPEHPCGDSQAPGHWEDEEFSRALQRVADTRSAAVGHGDGQPPADHATGAGQVTPRQDVASSPDRELVRALRQASRQLDRKANDLEDTSQFEDADQLRALSDRLRRQARRWVAGPAADERPGSQSLAPLPAATE